MYILQTSSKADRHNYFTWLNYDADMNSFVQEKFSAASNSYSANHMKMQLTYLAEV